MVRRCRPVHIRIGGRAARHGGGISREDLLYHRDDLFGATGHEDHRYIRTVALHGLRNAAQANLPEGPRASLPQDDRISSDPPHGLEDRVHNRPVRFMRVDADTCLRRKIASGLYTVDRSGVEQIEIFVSKLDLHVRLGCCHVQRMQLCAALAC